AHQHSRTATLLSVRVSRLFPCARLSHRECQGICHWHRLGWLFPCHPCSRLRRSIPCPCEFLFRFEGFDRYRPCPCWWFGPLPAHPSSRPAFLHAPPAPPLQR